MSKGCPSWPVNLGRRTALGLALGLGVLAAGCRGLPVRRLGPALATGEASADSDAGPVEDAPIHPWPPLPLRPIAGDEATATPLLDAIAARDAELARVVLDEIAEPEPAPPSLPTAIGPPPTCNYPDEIVTAEVAVAPEPAPSPTPDDTWEATLQRLRDLAHDQSRRPDALAPTWGLRERLLTWLAESPAAAEEGSSWEAVLATLIDGVPEEPPPTTEPALEIVELRLCRRVRGFGDFEPWPGDRLRAGQPVVLYCEMAGLRYEGAGPEQFRSRLASTVEFVAADGGAPVWSQPLGTADDLCRRVRRDYYVNYRLIPPSSLSPGPYLLRLTQTDLIAGQSTSRTLAISVGP